MPRPQVHSEKMPESILSLKQALGAICVLVNLRVSGLTLEKYIANSTQTLFRALSCWLKLQRFGGCWAALRTVTEITPYAANNAAAATAAVRQSSASSK